MSITVGYTDGSETVGAGNSHTKECGFPALQRTHAVPLCAHTLPCTLPISSDRFFKLLIVITNLIPYDLRFH